MGEEIKKGESNFSKYYVTEEFKEVLKQAYQYKKMAKRAWMFIIVITIISAVVPGVIIGLISKGNPLGYVMGRNNRSNNCSI